MECPFCEIAENKRFFYESEHSYGIYNLKPLIPGHIMIIPKKHRQHLLDLTEEENTDLFKTFRECCKILKKAYKKSGLSILIQDGIDAGQTVPHLHIHVTPMDGSLTTRDLVNNTPKSKDRPAISQEEMDLQLQKLRTATQD